jgi:hypothetical protein
VARKHLKRRTASLAYVHGSNERLDADRARRSAMLSFVFVSFVAFVVQRCCLRLTSVISVPLW